MDYKKSDLTKYAKDCTYASKLIVDIMCISEDISSNKISKEIVNEDNEQLLLEVAKRFAKYINDEMRVDLNNGAVQDCCEVINTLVEKCDENNWFR